MRPYCNFFTLIKNSWLYIINNNNKISAIVRIRMKNALWRPLLRTSLNLRFGSYFVIYVYVTWRAHQRFWRTNQKKIMNRGWPAGVKEKKWSDQKVKKWRKKVKWNIQKWISSDIRKKFKMNWLHFALFFSIPCKTEKNSKWRSPDFNRKKFKFLGMGDYTLLLVIVCES